MHYIRCVKPNDSMAAFGFEQQRVLLQLQCSGVLEMVRIRRQGFPSRLPFKVFEARFAPLLFEPGGAGGDMAAALTKSAQSAAGEQDESAQARSLAAEAHAQGRGGCLEILQRANLFEHRHYQFGKTLVFLRNGVEAALLTAARQWQPGPLAAFVQAPTALTNCCSDGTLTTGVAVGVTPASTNASVKLPAAAPALRAD